MSICNPCTRLKQISLCTDSIIIGTVDVYHFNTAHVVYFKSLANGGIYSYNVTSDGAGSLTLTLPEGFPLASGHAYEMWVNVSGDSIDTQSNLTIGSTTATCFTISATQVFDMYYGEFTNYSSQTLEVAE